MPHIILTRCTCTPTVDVLPPVEDEGTTLVVTHAADCGTVDLSAENEKLRQRLDVAETQLAAAVAVEAEVAVKA